MLRSENHFKEHRYRTLEHEHENVRANEPREENSREKVYGVRCTLPLLGHVQFGTLTSVHLPLVYHELTMRDVTFFTHTINISNKANTIGVNALMKMLRHDEHPNEAEEMRSLNEEQ